MEAEALGSTAKQQEEVQGEKKKKRIIQKESHPSVLHGINRKQPHPSYFM